MDFIDENGIYCVIQQTLKGKIVQYIQTNTDTPLDDNPKELKVLINLFDFYKI
jgi:hypothetical protein